jgi:hypothetical protein
MAVNLGNHEIESRPHLVGMLAAGLCALFVPSFFFHAIGMGGLLGWLATCSAAVQWPVMLVLWALSFVLVLGIARGFLKFVGRLIPALIALAAQIAEATARALTAAAFGSGALAVNLLAAAWYPVRCALNALAERVNLKIDLLLQGSREEQELRRLYNEEFRAEFATFKEFKRQFESGSTADSGARAGARSEKRETAPDAFAAACRLLGLAETGTFTSAELKKRYLTLIKGVHPDVAGPNELATQINAAHSLIKSRKGWS